MKIFSKRRAMTIYRHIRPPAFFDSAPADTNGMAVSVITLVRWFLTFPVYWRYTPNAVRIATDLIPV